MKKILAIILVMAMTIALLPSISGLFPAPIIQPGAPIVTDYCIPDYYSIGTFSLAHSQSVSFNIPATACPSLKKGPIFGLAATALSIGELTDIGVDADTAVIDIPQYEYNCYFKRACDCIVPPITPQDVSTNGGPIEVRLCFPRQLKICVASPTPPCLSITAYGAQEPIPVQFTPPIQTAPNEWCTFLPTLPPEVVRISIQNCGDSLQGEVSILECCCYDCYKQKALPTTLYPKIDIETFSVPGGATVIKDGKVLSKFEIAPGSQQVFLQVENRGFFTQNDTRLRFDGLPQGVTVELTPETQKIKAHNIASYSANFTVGTNVPSGTYQVTMVAYSPNGMFDKITFEFVVQ